MIPTGPDSVETGRAVTGHAPEKAGLELKDMDFVVSTGYGRIVIPFANKNVSEISCHAKGANWFFPSVRSILDMGGQDCKAIRYNEKGKVTDFAMNDKCAAGAGRSMEIMAELTGVPLEQMGELSLQTVEGAVPISSTCVVFARSASSVLKSCHHHRSGDEYRTGGRARRPGFSLSPVSVRPVFLHSNTELRLP